MDTMTDLEISTSWELDNISKKIIQKCKNA